MSWIPVLVFVAVLLWALARDVRAAARAQALVAAGRPADGTVLAVEQVADDPPAYAVTMRIAPYGVALPPYDATRRFRLSAPPEVGGRYAVWVDDEQPERWVFRPLDPAVGDPPEPDPLADPANLPEALAALNAARLAGRIDAAEFARRADTLLEAR